MAYVIPHILLMQLADGSISLMHPRKLSLVYVSY